MARVFLALPLPERLRTRLEEEVDRLKAVRAPVAWVEPRNLHITIRFIGDVEDAMLPLLEQVFRTATLDLGPLELVAVGLGAYPSRERPRVVWCGVKGETEAMDERLRSFRRRVDEGLRAEGFHREKGEFDPHITLGRVRGEDRLDLLGERMGPAVRREFGHFRASAAVLYESTQMPWGRSYDPLAELPF